jgi:hypothetical protein
MKKLILFICILFIAVPCSAHAEIIINEIAWMGTAHSASDEWIELANTGDASVSLTGWKLHTGDNSVNITLSGSISGNGLYLLERTDDTTVPDITADKIYTGSLSDSGEKLMLENNGSLVETLDFSSKWPAGNKDTNQTMQWNGSSWITAIGTPKAQNAGASASADAPADAISSKNITTTPPKIIPHIAFSIPSPLYSGVQYEIGAEAILEYMTPGYGYFVWNFGDGTYITKDSNTEPLTHTYQYSGNYTISFAYYRSSYDKKPLLMDSKKVEVFAPTVSLFVIENGDALVVKNSSDKVEDISDWHLDTDNGKTVFPPMTFIAPKAAVTFSAKTLGLSSVQGAKIYTPFAGFTTAVEKTIAQKSVSKTNISRASNVQSAYTQSPKVENVYTTADLEENQKPTQTKNHTKQIVLGAVILAGIGLFLLLERFIAQKE